MALIGISGYAQEAADTAVIVDEGAQLAPLLEARGRSIYLDGRKLSQDEIKEACASQPELLKKYLSHRRPLAGQIALGYLGACFGALTVGGIVEAIQGPDYYYLPPRFVYGEGWTKAKKCRDGMTRGGAIALAAVSGGITAAFIYAVVKIGKAPSRNARALVDAVNSDRISASSATLSPATPGSSATLRISPSPHALGLALQLTF